MSGMSGAGMLSGQASSLVFGHVELRLAERRVMVDGQVVALGSRGFDLLRALVNKRERVVSKDELLDEVWPGLVVEENNLQVQISGLRRVLGAGAITTVPGFGYRFTLASGLPEPGREPALHQQAPRATPPASSGAAARVLVADDNKVNRLLLCRSLELMGHQVSHASNGREALALLRQGSFDLLLLDLAMPELDGFGLLELRAGDAALSEVAVIVTSALGGVAPVARCIELGADDFLHKPVDPWLLKARVDASLLRKQQRDQQRLALQRVAPAGPAEARSLADATMLVARLHRLDLLEQAPQHIVELLNQWGTLTVDAVESRGGEVAQFTGDSLLAYFSDAPAAVQAARDVSDVLRLFNDERHALHRPAVATGTGLSRGPVVFGTAATARRTAHACIGAAVDRAYRLAAVSAAGGHAWMMDEPTRLAASPDAQALMEFHTADGPAFAPGQAA